MNSLFHVQFHLLNLSFADFILHLSSIFTPFHKLIASSNVVLLAHVSSTASALVNCMQTNRRHLLLHIHEQEYIAIIWLCLSVSADLKYRQICSLVCLVSSIHSLVCFFHQFAPLLQCKRFGELLILVNFERALFYATTSACLLLSNTDTETDRNNALECMINQVYTSNYAIMVAFLLLGFKTENNFDSWFLY